MLLSTELPYWLALWRIPRIGTVLFTRVLNEFGSLEDAFGARSQLLTALGLSSEQVDQMSGYLNKRNRDLVAAVDLDLHWLEEEDNHLITLNDPLYPALLKETDGAPPLLFLKGDPSLLNWPQIAIVGSRHPSRQGLQNANEFAKFFVQQGFVVTSGLAMGVDAAAHKGAIAGNGPTIGVTAHGLDKIFPKRNRELAQEMLGKGAWVSEFPIGVAPQPNYFPRRNRIISGLSLGVLVVEAAVKSGSLITARQAIQQNRDVFAIPGSIHNPLAKGCHAMIRQGAKLVEHAEDVTEELMPLLNFQHQQLDLSLKSMPDADKSGTETPKNVSAYERKSFEYQVLSVLDHDPMLVDEIVVRTGMNVADVNATLVMLEIEGAITSEQGGYMLATVT